MHYKVFGRMNGNGVGNKCTKPRVFNDYIRVQAQIVVKTILVAEIIDIHMYILIRTDVCV